MAVMDLFGYAFWALICGVIGWGAPLLDGTLRRVLFGATLGVIACVAFPFVRIWLGY